MSEGSQNYEGLFASGALKLYLAAAWSHHNFVDGISNERKRPVSA